MRRKFILDRYVALRFVASYGLCLATFALLFLVVDFFKQLDDFTESADALREQDRSVWLMVLRFYLTELPNIFVTLAPFMTLFAAIVTVVGFQRTNELSAMIASGRSVHRVLAPVYVLTAGLVALHAVTAEFVAPAASREHQLLRATFKNKGELVEDRLPHLRDGVNVYAVAEWLPGKDVLRTVVCKRFEDPREDGGLPSGAFDAEELRYRVHEGVEGWYPWGARLAPTEMDADGRVRAPLELPLEQPFPLQLTPQEVNLSVARSTMPGSFTRKELRQLGDRFPDQRSKLSLEMHGRFARPMAGLILVLLALPFVTQIGHRSVAYGLGVALGCCVVYVAVELLCTEFGVQGHLAPLVAAWMTPCFYGAIGISRLDLVAT